MYQKTKILCIVLVIISLVIAFFLGRISASPQASQNEITILSASAIRQTVEKEGDKPIEIRASSRGSKYYYPWCESTFSEENTIYFDSPEEAEKAGYEKATNCIEKTP